MKLKVTNKDIKSGGVTVLRAGYCSGIEEVLKFKCVPFGYGCGVYGWNYDVYHVNNYITLCAGYRPIGQKISWDLQEKWDKKYSAYRQKKYANYTSKKSAQTRLYNALIKDLQELA